MKIYRKLLSGILSATLLSVCLLGCSKQDVPTAYEGLSYPAGEVALGVTSYNSATPSVRANSTPSFELLSITHDNTELNLSLASINPATGVITIPLTTDAAAMGEYYASVRVTDEQGSRDYPNALKLTVKGIIFEQSKVFVERGDKATYPVKHTYLAQQEGTTYRFANEKTQATSGYEHISIDPQTCAITVETTAEAGIFPISIEAYNRTNPNGTLFTDVITITVESKPYGLNYSPATITLCAKEGHTSPIPTIYAGSQTDGEKVSYALVDDFQGIFSIDAATGEITLPANLDLTSGTAKTYNLQVRATNPKGTTAFPDVYTIIVDPAKAADPISTYNYSVPQPITLSPGQAWTSPRPILNGTMAGVEFTIVDAPKGVTIDQATGIITLAEGHHMPLQIQNNSLTLKVKNTANTSPIETSLSFSINPMIWEIGYKNNYSSDAVVNSGITNMDRYSFSGYIQSNRPKPEEKPTSTQVKNGWGKGSNRSWRNIFCLDAIGAGSGAWPGNTNQNNDWMVSSEITIPTSGFTPAICFHFASQFGKDANNFMEIYIVEINAQNVYITGPQNQDDKGMEAMPADLPWVALATTDLDNTAIATKIEPNHSPSSSGNLNTFELQPRVVDVSAYKGKKVRIAVRFWNPSQDTNNGRTFRLESLRVEDMLPTE